jgi:hypothetical protein
MANKRMFSKEVTNTDIFLDMPLSSQALYFHLGMNADDDWFVSPRSIIRLVGAKDDDMKVLIAKWLVIEFQDSVIVITHRKVNNEIKADRKKWTIHQRHLETLWLENKVYKPMTPKWLQNDSIDKIRLDKISIEYIDDFDSPKDSSTPANAGDNDEAKILSIQDKENLFNQFWLSYPNKKGKWKAKILRSKISWVDYKDIIKACKIYAWEVKWKDMQYIKHWDTWLKDNWWEDYTTLSREELYNEMKETFHGDVDNRPDTAYGKNYKSKYEAVIWEWRYDIWFEDKQEIKKEVEEKRKAYRLANNGKDMPW